MLSEWHPGIWDRLRPPFLLFPVSPCLTKTSRVEFRKSLIGKGQGWDLSYLRSDSFAFPGVKYLSFWLPLSRQGVEETLLFTLSETPRTPRHQELEPPSTLSWPLEIFHDCGPGVEVCKNKLIRAFSGPVTLKELARDPLGLHVVTTFGDHTTSSLSLHI